ncbi:MAG: DUF3822 family protein [Bacteroidales bacterium]|nr:DUF3822 family protein [Bacteroidales bacterium]
MPETGDHSLPSIWFDPDFDQENIPDYDLTVLASRDALVFVILRLGKIEGIVRLADLSRAVQAGDPEALHRKLIKSGLPEGMFHQLDLYLRDDQYSLIPEVLIRDNDPRDILSLRFLLPANETAEKFVRDELACVFIGRPALSDALQERCRKFSLRSYGILVAQEAIRLSAGKKDIMLADLGNRSLDIALASAGELKFCNAFTIRTAEDAAYHLLNVYRQQQASPFVYLTGNLVHDSRITNLVLPYLKDHSFLTIDSGLKLSDEIPGGEADLITLLNQLR